MAAPGTTETKRSDIPPAPPCTLVIFGGGGDLTKRLLMPALYNLASEGLLDPALTILGVDHNDGSDEGWRASLSATMQSFTKDDTGEFHTDHIDPAAWGFIESRLHYVKGDFGDPATFSGLATRIQGNAVFYLAVSARFFGPVADALGAAGLLKEKPGTFRRLIVEKPFGSDLASAKALNATLLKAAEERQIFRIDHFLGKETVQSLMAIRFGNALFEPVWRREFVDSIEITAAETIGVEERGGFYEPTGALRDMVPNHLFQLLTMTAMECPASLDAEAIRDEKAKLIAAIAPVRPADAARGQYGAGSEFGAPVKAYRAEDHVSPQSTTQTYAALKLTIDTPRWAGVPFYLRTGKRLAERRTEIAVHFKTPAAALLPAEPNLIRLQIDPTQGTQTSFAVKLPGPKMRLATATSQFHYADVFPRQPTVGYEGLLYGCMTGDATLFQRADMIEGSWAAVQPLIDGWADGAPELYPAGSPGPASADALLARDGRAWLPLGGAAA